MPVHLLECIRAGRLHVFYTSADWLHLRRSVLEYDHFECQHCKQRGKYTRASTVHHVRYVRKCPDLALSKWYQDEEGRTQRNLISLCHDCHEAEHGHRRKHVKSSLTVEQW